MLNEEPPGYAPSVPNRRRPRAHRFQLLAKIPRSVTRRRRSGPRSSRARFELRSDLELNYSGMTQSLTGVMPVTRRPPERRSPSSPYLSRALVISGAAWWRIQRDNSTTALPIETQWPCCPLQHPRNAEDAAFGNGLAGIVAGASPVWAPTWCRRTIWKGTALPRPPMRAASWNPHRTGRQNRREPRGFPRCPRCDRHGIGPALRSAVVTADTSTEPLQDKVLTQAVVLLHISPDPNAMSKARAENTHTASATITMCSATATAALGSGGNLGFALASFQKAINVTLPTRWPTRAGRRLLAAVRGRARSAGSRPCPRCGNSGALA